MTAPPVVTLHTTGPEATRALGGVVAGLLEPGDVVSLTGELGAGKTCLVQGAARALGVTDRVTSPTFTLVKTYPRARIPIVHVDVYRLNRLRDVLSLGDDVFAPDAVTFVEWGDAIASVLPPDRLEIDLVHAAPGTAGDDGRRLRITGHGRVTDRLGALASACAPWTGAA